MIIQWRKKEKGQPCCGLRVEHLQGRNTLPGHHWPPLGIPPVHFYAQRVFVPCFALVASLKAPSVCLTLEHARPTKKGRGKEVKEEKWHLTEYPVRCRLFVSFSMKLLPDTSLYSVIRIREFCLCIRKFRTFFLSRLDPLLQNIYVWDCFRH